MKPLEGVSQDHDEVMIELFLNEPHFFFSNILSYSQPGGLCLRQCYCKCKIILLFSKVDIYINVLKDSYEKQVLAEIFLWMQ